MLPDAFYLPDGDELVATALTRGPWDPRFQHGGPPSALLAGALCSHGPDAADFALARVTVELLRPVPIGRVAVRARVDRSGRTVQRLSAALVADGVEVATASGIRIRRQPTDLDDPPAEAWASPDGLQDYVFRFFTEDVGYHRAVQVRYAAGAWPGQRVKVWARPRVPLVAGRATLAEERVLIIADAQSGMCPPVSPFTHTYVNPDLTVYFARPPIPDADAWLGFDLRASAGPLGTGLAEAGLRDADGVFGRSAQSMVVQAR